MIVLFSANGVTGTLPLPSLYLVNARNEDLAELAAAVFWRERPNEIPPEVTVIHLQDVDGYDFGAFKVRREMRPVFTATALPMA
jgi:hypothetical protein